MDMGLMVNRTIGESVKIYTDTDTNANTDTDTDICLMPSNLLNTKPLTLNFLTFNFKLL